jgi:hypothetical protein
MAKLLKWVKKSLIGSASHFECKQVPLALDQADSTGILLPADSVPLDETSGVNISGNDRDTAVCLDTTPISQHCQKRTLLVVLHCVMMSFWPEEIS